MTDDLKNMNIVSKTIFIINVLLALLIIIFATTIIKTDLGSYSLAFGFAMLTITIILRILRKW